MSVNNYYIEYTCQRSCNTLNRCEGCSIPSYVLDEASWEKAVEIIRDPSEVDHRVKQLTGGDPTIDHRKKTRNSLADIRKRQTALRNNLNDLMQQEKLDKGTKEFFSGQLLLLAK